MVTLCLLAVLHSCAAIDRGGWYNDRVNDSGAVVYQASNGANELAVDAGVETIWATRMQILSYLM